MIASNRSAGFSLLEVLVVLVVLGLVGMVLFDGLGRVLDARSRLAPRLDRATDRALAAEWFRNDVNGLVPLPGDRAFQGGSEGFTGTSTAALEGHPGTPTASSWQLSHDDARNRTVLLAWGESGRRGDVFSWPGRGGRFSYLGTDHRWHETWPPSDEVDEEGVPMLPLLVRLELPLEDGGVLVAAPLGALAPASLDMPPQ